MPCMKCGTMTKEVYALPNRDNICGDCLIKLHIRLINNFDLLLNQFLDYLIRQQEKSKMQFIQEMMK